jgi:NitT/TauT family transport system substrate-binding protein
MTKGIARLRGAALVASVSAILIGTGLPATAADKVTLGMPLQLTTSDGGIYAIANELGFFKDENIDLEIVSLDGAGAVMPQLLQNRLTMSFLKIDALFGTLKSGTPPTPLTFFYNDLPFNTTEIATLASSGITKLEDFKGKKIGVPSLTWDVAQTRAALRSVGLKPGEDVDIVAIGPMAAGQFALKEGRVDALRYPFYWNDILASQGMDINRVPFPPLFRKLASAGFIASADAVKNNADLFARFGRAYTKGVVVCDVNPEACVKAFWRANPQAAPTANEADALKAQTAIITKRVSMIMRDEDGKARTNGAFDIDLLKQFVTTMQANGELLDVTVDEANAAIAVNFTNALTDKFNDFDRAALEAQAKALQ